MSFGETIETSEKCDVSKDMKSISESEDNFVFEDEGIGFGEEEIDMSYITEDNFVFEDEDGFNDLESVSNEIMDRAIVEIYEQKSVSNEIDDETTVENLVLEDNDSPRKIKTINDDLEDQKHPETGVLFEKKVVETDTGEKVEGVFPQFESEFDAQLPEDLYLAKDKEQCDECNLQLKEKYDSDPSFREKFTPEQQSDIEAGRTPCGYVWHHNEETGKMQLVDWDTHWNTRHTGGRSIWGGGSINRK